MLRWYNTPTCSGSLTVEDACRVLLFPWTMDLKGLPWTFEGPLTTFWTLWIDPHLAHVSSRAHWDTLPFLGQAHTSPSGFSADYSPSLPPMDPHSLDCYMFQHHPGGRGTLLVFWLLLARRAFFKLLGPCTDLKIFQGLFQIFSGSRGLFYTLSVT